MGIRLQGDNFDYQVKESIKVLKKETEDDQMEYKSVDDMVWQNKERWAEILFEAVSDQYGWDEFED